MYKNRKEKDEKGEKDEKDEKDETNNYLFYDRDVSVGTCSLWE